MIHIIIKTYRASREYETTSGVFVLQIYQSWDLNSTMDGIEMSCKSTQNQRAAKEALEGLKNNSE